MSPTSHPTAGSRCGFTLLEVMIALAVVAIALTALLGLHHQALISVIRGQELSQAALLAQEVMTQAELERYPDLGRKFGDFRAAHPRLYDGFKWQRVVEPSGAFPDVRKIKVRIVFGAGFHRSFDLIEFIHSPYPPNPVQ